MVKILTVWSKLIPVPGAGAGDGDVLGHGQVVGEGVEVADAANLLYICTSYINYYIYIIYIISYV